MTSFPGITPSDFKKDPSSSAKENRKIVGRMSSHRISKGDENEPSKGIKPAKLPAAKGSIQGKVSDAKTQEKAYAKPLPPNPPRPSAAAKAKPEFKHSDPVEILRKIEEKENASDTREQKIEKFVAKYLHPFITGEKTQRDSEPMMEKLFRTLDPENKLADTEKKEIEQHAYGAYLKQAANGLYIHAYLLGIENETRKAQPAYPAPSPSMDLIKENSPQFTVLMNALNAAVPIDFPSRGLDQLTHDAAAALKAVNEEKAQEYIQEGDRMISDQKARGRKGNPEIMQEGMFRKQRGEALLKALKMTEAGEATSKETDARVSHLINILNRRYADSDLISSEMAQFLADNDFHELIVPTQGNAADYAERLQKHLYALADKFPEMDQKILKNGLDQLVSLVDTAKKSTAFKNTSDENIALIIAQAVIQANIERMTKQKEEKEKA